MNKSLSKNRFSAIERYFLDNNIKLGIIDFNGVLDDFYEQKIHFLKSLLGNEYANMYAELFVFIEQRYIENKARPLNDIIKDFFHNKDIEIGSDRQKRLDKKPLFSSNITKEARAFLEGISIDIVIYTSMSYSQARLALGDTKCNLVTRDDNKEEKPSINNLVRVVNHYGDVSPNQVCVVGDGLIDDIMPAFLLNYHAILVTPYASECLVVK